MKDSSNNTVSVSHNPKSWTVWLKSMINALFDKLFSKRPFTLASTIRLLRDTEEVV